MLALHVEGDLSEAREEMTSRHLATCGDCRRFLEQLGARQSLLKSLRRETVSPSECMGMRREVMSIINERVDKPGWTVRIERAIMLGFRRPLYAVVAFGLLGIVSVSVLAQIRHVTADAKQSAALFEDEQTLLRPEGYRDWIRVGESTMPHPSSKDSGAESAMPSPTHSVYINPSGYREYAKTGRFPEGTLMVWESERRQPLTTDHAHKGAPMLLASVKDSRRFDGGWGFFDFTGVDGTVTAKAQALPESSGCRTCHKRDAETDHVFTQFYRVLQAARRTAQLGAPQESVSLKELLVVSHQPRLRGPALVADI
jgi:hypothetical protein